MFHNVIGYKKFTKSQILSMISNTDILRYIHKNINLFNFQLDLLDLNELVKNNIKLKDECFNISDKLSNEYIVNKIKNIDINNKIYKFIYELLLRRNILKKYDIKLNVNLQTPLSQSMFNKLEKNIIFKISESDGLHDDYDVDYYDDYGYDERLNKLTINVKASYIKIINITNSKINIIMCELSFYAIDYINLKHFSIPLFITNGIRYTIK